MSFEKDFDLPPDQVFEFFAEHENLGPILGAKITRLTDGSDGTRNGVGSSRRIKPAGPVPAFVETVVAYVPNKTIDYKVTEGTPLKDHLGEVTFTPKGTGTHMEWKIMIDASVPGLDFVISKVLKAQIGRGLAKADPAA